MTTRLTPRRGRRIGRAVPGVVLGAVLVLSGCADDGGDYCAALADEKETLADLSGSAPEGGTDVLTPTLESFERLKAAAPDELKDEWETLVVAYQALADAVQEAGVDPEDYRAGKAPEGLSKQDAARLAAVASKLTSARVTAAAAGIEQHADEVCGVDFTG